MGERQKSLDCFGPELGARTTFDLFDGGSYRGRLPVRPVGCHRIECVGDREQARAERYLFSGEAMWIAVAIPVFVVREDDLFRFDEEGDLIKDAPSDDRV